MAKMNHTLEELTNSYSLFKENQVLTASQLNGIVKYFDDQDRLTRTLGIGVGLICGLDLKFDQSGGTIDIGKGCGITTDGDLLYWDDLYSFSKYRAFQDEKAEYPYFNNEGGNIRLWELFDKGSEQEGLSALSAWTEIDDTEASIQFDDLAVIAYLENYQKEPDTCTELDCDNQGIQILRNLKFLLIEKSSLQFIIENYDTIYKKYKKVNASQNKLPLVKLERIVINSLNAESEAKLYAAYATAINRLRVPFISALEKLYLNYSNLLDSLNNIPFSSWEVRLTSSLKFSLLQTKKYFQYNYDWAKDLVHTYLELRQVLHKLEKECCPNPLAFPKHLMVSELIPSGKPEFRHDFYPSPAVSRESESLENAKFLFHKLNHLILDFKQPSSGDIQITPSKLHSGRHAIPYYYEVAKVYDQWNFDLSKNGREDENLSFYANNYSSDDVVLKPLKYDIDQYDFFRIEGHIGQDYTTVIKEIKSKVSSNGLPVEVVALRLGSIAESLNLDDYSSYFDDLKVILKAWEVELNCLMKTLSRFFSGFKLDSAGTHYDYKPKVIAEAESKPIEKAKVPVPTFYAENAYQPLKSLSTKVSYNLGTAFKESTTYKMDTTVRDNVVMEEDTLGKVLDKVFKENPAGSDNDIINNTYKELQTGYDISGWSANEKEVAIDIPLNVIAVANDIGKYKPGDLGLMEEVDIVSEFERKLAQLCQQASKWNSKVNTYFTRAEYTKVGYEEKYLQILGELAQSCCSAEKLKIIREEIAKRKEEILENTLLAKYAEKHPGLDHLAGVPKGGTFVLVYKDSAKAGQEPEKVANTAEFGTRKIDSVAFVKEANENFKALSEYQRISATNKSIFNITANNLFGSIKETSNLEYIGKIAELYNEAVGIQKGVATEESNLPGFTVVADFYLPYICCSDCPPMSFVIPKERVSLRLPVEFLCSNDENVYPFQIVPADGVVASGLGGEAIELKDGQYYFDPGKLSSEDYGKTIEFTVNGQQTDATLVVYEHVEASFTVPEENIKCYQEKGIGIVKFNNTTPIPPDATLKYEWDFGDNTLSDQRFDRDPVHQYNLRDIQSKQPFTITLKVSSGRCTSFAEQEITICEVVIDPCIQNTVKQIVVLSSKVSNYKPESFGDFVGLYQATVEVTKRIVELSDRVFEQDVQVEMLNALLKLNRETAETIQSLGDDVKTSLPLAQLYLDQVMLMLSLLRCNWTEEGFGKEIRAYFEELVQSVVSFILEVMPEIRRSDFVQLLEAYINSTPKVPDEFVQILKKIFEMFKQ